MKAIQILLDDALLSELDATEEVKRDGRSAVMRRAAAEYLLRRRRLAVREQYRRAYAAETGLGPDFAGWEEEGTWPEE
ncbi:MAG TPA: hypothetical protein VMN60_11820 [Longimicrobiales bacterium]|nr:hypothetical protein [Longimicrobiales bacterium]